MIANLLICALTVFSPVQGDEGYEYSHETYSADKVIDQKFWNQKKSLRVGYEFHDFQNSIGMMTPDKFSFGLSSIHSIWFHKKPIGNVLKIGFDHGLDLNYSRFEDPGHDNGYNGPSGFLGSGSNLPVQEESITLPSLGMNYFSIGYALGVSVTINPVAKLRLCGYCHFVPSAAIDNCDMSANIGFMPYVKYGFEMTYSWIGFGIEYGTGKAKMQDMVSVISTMTSEEPVNMSGAPYYSNYSKAYIVFRMGRKKR
ncbi:MAG: hypothetical protein J6A22_04575 [Bacteroidales bacterium]|nr:hypothetical protein [Bacteroidales bacterium]